MADKKMSEIEIVHEDREEGYARPLFRAALRDSRLSWAARGLFSFLWDLPAGWSPKLSHLIRMAPEGRDAVRARLQELRAVGAMRLEAIRGDAGRVTGTRWVIISPRKWAIESSLDSDHTEKRVFRNSAPPTVVKAAPKGLLGKGSAKEKTTTTQSTSDGVAPEGAGGGGPHGLDPQYLSELVEAAVFTARKIENQIAFRRRVRERIKKEGPHPDDLAALQEYLRHRDAAREQAARVQADRLRDAEAETPEARYASLVSFAAESKKWKEMLGTRE